MRHAAPEDDHALLLRTRNPGWWVEWSPAERVYHACRIVNLRTAHPHLTDPHPAVLEGQMRRPLDELLNESLAAAVRNLRQHGRVPDWRPPRHLQSAPA